MIVFFIICMENSLFNKGCFHLRTPVFRLFLSYLSVFSKFKLCLIYISQNSTFAADMKFNSNRIINSNNL